MNFFNRTLVPSFAFNRSPNFLIKYQLSLQFNFFTWFNALLQMMNCSKRSKRLVPKLADWKCATCDETQTSDCCIILTLLPFTHVATLFADASWNETWDNCRNAGDERWLLVPLKFKTKEAKNIRRVLEIL